ncbi:hypothetical protein DF3PB_1140012 [uncultured Defluviicoccus sp.]|uniref:Uncharacterized protein n=1 Tax=metagenome TaxID=256318 RepID=A0A380T9D5_9ZZZZ|nr:hypothetical protein DF3PB_1140012 [uncultured Defluviicoccus sp.]
MLPHGRREPKGDQNEGGGAQRGCLLPALAPFAAPAPRRAALRQPELGNRLVDLPTQHVQELRRVGERVMLETDRPQQVLLGLAVAALRRPHAGILQGDEFLLFLVQGAQTRMISRQRLQTAGEVEQRLLAIANTRIIAVEYRLLRPPFRCHLDFVDQRVLPCLELHRAVLLLLKDRPSRRLARNAVSGRGESKHLGYLYINCYTMYLIFASPELTPCV